MVETPRSGAPSAAGSIPTERVEMVIGGKRVNVTPFDDDERRGKGYYYEGGERHVVDLSRQPEVSQPRASERRPLPNLSTPESYLEQRRLQALADSVMDPNDRAAKTELARLTNMASNLRMGNREPVKLEIEREIGELKARFDAARGSLKPIGKLPGDDEYKRLKQEIARLKASKQGMTETGQILTINAEILRLKALQSTTERGRLMHTINTTDVRIKSLETLKSSLQ